MLASMVLTRHHHPWFPTSPWKILGYKEHREEHRRQEHRQPHGHAVGQLSDAGPPQVSVFTHTLRHSVSGAARTVQMASEFARLN